MQKGIKFLIFLLILGSGAVYSQGTAGSSSDAIDTSVENKQVIDELFRHAAEDYRRGNWSEAARKYNEIYSRGISNHVVFHNLGNCYFRMNNLGMAILAWEKGLRLKPGDKQLLQNLNYASKRVVDKFEEPEQQFFSAVLSGIGSLFTNSGWVIFTIVNLWIAGILLFLLQLNTERIPRRITIYLFVFFFMACLFSGAVAIVKHKSFADEEYAIVLASEARIRSGPAVNNPVLFILHEGVKVKVEGSSGNWLRISVPNGYNGWLKKDRVGII